MEENAIEDKTCRICGFVDTNNVNIFDKRWKNILYKILTIFPITIYESDPLPKNICRKCVTNVSLIFDESQKVLKVQKRWIDNVKINQPNHRYVDVLNIIEQSNKDMINSIQDIAHDFPHRHPRPAFQMIKQEQVFSENLNSLFPNNTVPTNSINIIKYGSQIDDNFTTAKKNADSNYQRTGSKNRLYYHESMASNKWTCLTKATDFFPNKIKEIQNKLQSNGCTLLSINSKNLMNNTSSCLKVQCQYCTKTFPNEKFLAKHQLQHLTISDRNICAIKYLERKERRGKIVPMGQNKYIRCLNCWKLFLDNVEILDHWSQGECDFFCYICGLEFINNQKRLREHVLIVHGIRYKCSKPEKVEEEKPKLVMRDMFKKTTTPFIPQSASKIRKLRDIAYKPKSKIKNANLNGRVSCSICFCTFPNFQSKNSHMRKHKSRLAKNETSGKVNNNVNIEVKSEPEENLEKRMEISSYSHVRKLRGNKNIVISSDKPRLQVKKLSDLQDPLISSQLSEHANENQQSEGLEFCKIYNCHPCGQKFSSKTKLFEHKRRCQLNNKFACRFCLRAFVTSADLQVHILLMHGEVH